MFDDVPPLTKMSHGNSDTRLGQWLHSSRSQGKRWVHSDTDITTSRSERVTAPEAEGGLTEFTPPGSRQTVAVTTRPAKKTRQTTIAVTSPHHTAGPTTIVQSPLTRRDFIVKFAAAHGVDCAALLDIWQSNKHGYNKAYDAPFARFKHFFGRRIPRICLPPHTFDQGT